VTKHQNHLQQSQRHNWFEPFPVVVGCRRRIVIGIAFIIVIGRLTFPNVPAGPARDESHGDGFARRQRFIGKPQNAHGDGAHALARVEEGVRQRRHEPNGDHGGRIEEHVPDQKHAPVEVVLLLVEKGGDGRLVFV